jgi:hypothetical protein
MRKTPHKKNYKLGKIYTDHSFYNSPYSIMVAF